MGRGAALAAVALLFPLAPVQAQENGLFRTVYSVKLKSVENLHLIRHDSGQDRVIATGAGGRRFRIRRAGAGIIAVPFGGTVPVPERAPAMLPDGTVARGGRGIRRAWLARPTRRYGHGVLGDAVEAGAVRVETAPGRVLEFVLPASSVFEDRHVRLSDVTGDGRDDALVVRSYLEAGAALAVLAVRRGRLEIIAEAPPLGLANRWLNPVGVADFDGDGRLELAVVTTPHIGGVLRLYRLKGRRLAEIYRVSGFSNHAMGSRELGLSAVLDLDGDGVKEIVLPDNGRRRLRVVGFAGGRPSVRPGPARGSEIVTAIVVADLAGDGAPALVYGLADGTVVAAWR